MFLRKSTTGRSLSILRGDVAPANCEYTQTKCNTRSVHYMLIGYTKCLALLAGLRILHFIWTKCDIYEAYITC